MDWKRLYEDFSDLSKTEQMRLFQAIKDTLFPEEKEDISKMIHQIREVRFSNGLACFHCGSIALKRNGKYRSRQRYLCKDCGKSFNDMTASPISGTHYPHKWLKYVDGKTLPKIAEELEIHISTAFYWRHKILNALRSLGFSTLKGIIESDETYFLESDKGKKRIIYRKPRKRGGKATKRGISKEQKSVVVAHDRNGNIISKMAGRGRISADEIDQVLSEYLDKEIVLCTDSATNYKAFAKQKGISHEIINANKGVHVRKGVYHIQHVNAYHQRLKKWMERFNGVATKYIDNYLFWFRFLELNKQLSKKLCKQTMVLDACKRANHITIKTFKIA
ncbi:IS1595 family transposase [Brevibacillus sp. SYP-B805]|uniref:IS1595 family transposase n=1 Tax=Brevibacillus sp. SYP-B805 TaxID=1578199 RepID=UPI0013EC7072|nr:IS1595 family transposase [Brevibacillus sp. SYP-B805]NGQ94871.1 IS1595 family transposase [Brevibacillus sp. SYP-B805]